MQSDCRRSEFIAAALELFDERGIDNTSIGAITGRMGVTRSLFYHYFADKTAIVDASMDSCVDDFVERVTQWNRQYDATHSRDSLNEIVSLIKDLLQAYNTFTKTGVNQQNAALRQRFCTRSADRLARKFEHGHLRRNTCDGELAPRATALTHPYETYYVLAVGLMSLLNLNPDVDNDVLIDLIIDGLHLQT